MALANPRQPDPTPVGSLNPPQGPPAVVFDPAPHINAIEHGLKDWLNRPTQDILRDLGLNSPDEPHQDHEADPAAAGPGGAGGGGMIAGLMGPLVGMLGMLGTGVFQGLDPSQMFEPATQAFQQGASSLQGLMGQMGGGGAAPWLGSGAAGTATKTGQIVGDGAKVSAQASSLGAQGVQSGTTTQQGYSRMLELVHEIHDRLAALSGGLPWTGPVMGETGAEGTDRGIELITELETMLAAQAATMAATGMPQAVTAAPEAASSMMGPMMQTASSLAGPAMKAATTPLTMGSKMLGQGMQSAMMMANQLGSQLGQAAGKGGGPGGTHPAASAQSAHTTGRTGGLGGARGGGGSGGGSGGTPVTRALNTSSMLQNETAAATQGATRAVAGTGGAGVAGGAAGGAGAGGRAGAGSNSGSHSAASFLHTTEQGGEIVGDLGTVAPPVLGAADPNNDSPDVELRI